MRRSPSTMPTVLGNHVAARSLNLMGVSVRFIQTLPSQARQSERGPDHNKLGEAIATRTRSGNCIRKPRLSEKEAISERIIGRNQELVPSGYVSTSLHLRNYGGIFAEVCFTNDSSSEVRANQAFDHERLADSQCSSRVFQCEASAHPGARRRAIDFAVRKDAHVADIGIRAKRRTVDDRPVQEAEVFFERMLDL